LDRNPIASKLPVMPQTTASPHPARVLVVDRHAGARLGVMLALRTTPDLELAAEASDLEGALALLRDGAEVDIVALDGRAARPDPAAAIAAIGRPVVLLRVESGPDFERLARRAGAVGQARKDDADSIVAALADAAAGPFAAAA
jgi:DNA-binding NarL/FixJ family response regulator